MDRFIGPIQPPSGPQVVPRWTGNKKDRSPFHLDPKAEPHPPARDEGAPHAPSDLPVGHARFDEAGRRIDYTA